MAALALLFRHPPHDFDSQDAAVTAYDPRKAGYEWKPVVPAWQRHDPAGMGQAWCKAARTR